MSFLQSITVHGDSIVKVCIGYITSIVIFAIYNRRLRSKANTRTTAKMLPAWGNFCWRVATIFPVAFIAGIRGPITGADTKNVWHGYLQAQHMPLSEILEGDIGSVLYRIVRWAIANITNGNVQIFMFLWAFATLYFVVLGIEQWNIKYAGFSLFIFFCCFGLQLMNQMRQLLAVSIILYAYHFAFHGKTKKFLMWAFIAGAIHLSAWLAAIVILYLVVWRDKAPIIYSINHYKSKNIGYYIVIGLACLALPYLITVICEIVFTGTKYQYLLDEMHSSSIGLGFILTLIPTVFPSLFFGKKMQLHSKFRNVLLMVIPCRLAGYSFYYIYRMFYYFGIINVVAFPKIIENESYKRKQIAFLCISICCILYFLAYYCWLSADVFFPYVTYKEIEFVW